MGECIAHPISPRLSAYGLLSLSSSINSTRVLLSMLTYCFFLSWNTLLPQCTKYSTHAQHMHIQDNSDYYEGEYANGCRSGLGCYHHSNGVVIQGEWKLDVENGRCRKTSSSSVIIADRMWSNGKETTTACNMADLLPNILQGKSGQEDTCFEVVIDE